jgi:hypothetical protein
MDLREIYGVVYEYAGMIWLRIGTPVENSCEHGNEHSGSIK